MNYSPELFFLRCQCGDAFHSRIPGVRLCEKCSLDSLLGPVSPSLSIPAAFESAGRNDGDRSDGNRNMLHAQLAAATYQRSQANTAECLETLSRRREARRSGAAVTGAVVVFVVMALLMAGMGVLLSLLADAVRGWL